jgi:hypothetical protein
VAFLFLKLGVTQSKKRVKDQEIRSGFRVNIKVQDLGSGFKVCI